MKLGLVAIVKNEATRIERCLASAIAAGVTVATIVDTGSTDDTMALIRAACAGIDLQLSSSPFVNMGHNRSEAFALARGSADWLLALDADMTAESDPDFVPDPAVDAYQIEMRSGQWAWRLPLLLRGDIAWKSTGSYHEWTGRADGLPFTSIPTDAVRVHLPLVPTSPQKYHWQAGLLENEIAHLTDNGDNSGQLIRATFYLAQTYRQLGDPRARDLYLRRVEMGGWEEEAWMALYWSAKLADWPARAAELMAVWERRPSRLEPLRDLVRELNDRGQHHAAYALACVPVVPTIDLGFTEPAVYAWEMSFQRSIAAWWCGHADETLALCDELLARTDIPTDVRAATERNRALCGPA